MKIMQKLAILGAAVTLGTPAAIALIWSGRIDERVTNVQKTQEERTPLIQRFIAAETKIDVIDKKVDKLDERQQRMEDKINDLHANYKRIAATEPVIDTP